MAAVPVFEEQTGGAAAVMMAGLAGLELNEPALAQIGRASCRERVLMPV